MPPCNKSSFRFDGLVKSPIIVMPVCVQRTGRPDPGSKPAPDLIRGPGQALISLPRHVVSRGHPEPVEFTGFRRLPRTPIRLPPE